MNLRAIIGVNVAADVVEPAVASFGISGGGAATSATADPTRLGPLPAFGIDAFDAAIEAEGSSLYRQAGGHPGAIVNSVDFNTVTSQSNGFLYPVEPVKDISVQLPPGLVGDPTAIAQCSTQELSVGEGIAVTPTCSVDSQVGTVKLRVNNEIGTSSVLSPIPLFNMVPAPGVAARFGFNVLGTVVTLNARLKQDGAYSLEVGATDASEGLALAGVTTTFWGRPHSPQHDSQRHCPGQGEIEEGSPSCSAGEEVAFLRMPTSCGPDLGFGLHIDSWTHPGAETSTGAPDLADANWKSSAVVMHEGFGYPYPREDWGAPVGTADCEKVPVKGKLSATPTAIDSETSTGLAVHVEVPNPGIKNPEGLSTSDIKSVKVVLPEGVTINPSQAEGLGVCSEPQFESSRISVDAEAEGGCPDDAKIGTVEVHTPILKETIPGDVYVATPYENPFNALLALYIVLHEPQRGVLVKLAGKVDLDPRTGQITTTFENLPQIPFSDFEFNFRQGARAPLVTPPTCGTFTTEALMTPWSDPGHPLVSKSNFEVVHGIGGGPCPSGQLPPFKPGLIAGSINNSAGAFSPFYARLFRRDGEQEITHFSIKLPPGVAAKLAGVPECSDAAIEGAKSNSGSEELLNPSCPAASEIGHTLVGAGVGSVLTYAPGKLYLAGPFHGSQLSIAAITAAKVGPFDLGTVVVRQALKINPETAEVFVDATGSDPIPHIIKGITTHLRDIRVYVDRPEFALNPTNCEPTSTASTVLGSGLDFASEADDQPVTVTTRYQAANCASLRFKPKLSLKLIGGTKRSDTPKLRAVLRAKRGEANIASTQVVLPHSEFLESTHIRTTCTRVQFAGDSCPAGSVYGHATAVTPLLDEPLSGPVYLRSNGGERKLPDLVAALHSGRIDIDLVGYIDSVGNGQLRTTFAKVPDAPVSKFVLTMQGGKKGLLVNSTNLCRRVHRAKVKMVGQNGKLYAKPTLLQVKCRRGGH